MPEEPKDITLMEAIRELKHRDPFRPFSIVVASGDRYVIENGENLVEMKNELFYALPGGEKFVFLRNNQIVAVENTANGSKAKRRR
jgi:hypothetical protein